MPITDLKLMVQSRRYEYDISEQMSLATACTSASQANW